MKISAKLSSLRTKTFSLSPAVRVSALFLTAMIFLSPLSLAADSEETSGDVGVRKAHNSEPTAAEKQAAKAAAKEANKAERAAKKAQKAEEKAAKKAARENQKRENKARYQKILVDNGLTYFLDTKNSRWIPFPGKTSERIIDTWLRVVPDETGSLDNQSQTGTLPATYFLEHYYIRPDTREIMFISELEVYGRPSNNIKEPPYDPSKWEQLIPGSLEDDIFDAVVRKMSTGKAKIKAKDRMSIRDMLEEYGRVSL